MGTHIIIESPKIFSQKRNVLAEEMDESIRIKYGHISTSLESVPFLSLEA